MKVILAKATETQLAVGVPSARRAALHITVPAEKAMRALTHGGFGELPGDAVTADLAENEDKRREVSRNMPRERAIENMVRGGHESGFAAKWVDALVAGGETSATALDLFRQHAHPDGGQQYAADEDALPRDRRLRGAWRNVGDAVTIDMTDAKLIFATRLVWARNLQSDRFKCQMDVATILGGGRELESLYETLKALDLRKLGDRVSKSSSPEELLSIWPDCLEWNPRQLERVNAGMLDRREPKR